MDEVKAHLGYVRSCPKQTNTTTKPEVWNEEVLGRLFRARIL